ncbi:MAG: hypothetical protein KJN99_05500, partial [Marinicaulis sp.]|nr:hypothetical protein [Marinicaulis sp.]
MSDVQHKDVSTDEVGMRLDRWFKVHFPELRHSALEKLLRKGQIRVDGGRIKANRRLDAGETVRIPPLGDLASKARAPARPKDLQNADEIRKFVIFEDKAIIALNKPFGLAVQGGTNTKRHIDGMLGALAEGG